MRRPLALGVACACLLGPGTEGRAEEALPVAVCVACLVTVGEPRHGYDEEAWEQLRSGEILTAEMVLPEGGRGARRAFTSTALLEASPARVWIVVTDWESFPRFMPNVAETRVRRVEGSRAWISQHLRIFFTSIRYGAIWNLDAERGVARFALDPDWPHDIAANQGTWRLVPVDRGVSTLVHYSAQVDTGRPVPRFVENALTRRSLPEVLQGLRREVERRNEDSR